MRVTSEEVRGTRCPACQAPGGQPCSPPAYYHRSRVRSAERTARLELRATPQKERPETSLFCRQGRCADCAARGERAGVAPYVGHWDRRPCLHGCHGTLAAAPAQGRNM